MCLKGEWPWDIDLTSRGRDASFFSSDFKKDWLASGSQQPTVFVLFLVSLTKCLREATVGSKGLFQTAVGKPSVYRLWDCWFRPLVENTEKAPRPLAEAPGWTSASLTCPQVMWMLNSPPLDRSPPHGPCFIVRSISHGLKVKEGLILSKSNLPRCMRVTSCFRSSVHPSIRPWRWLVYSVLDHPPNSPFRSSTHRLAALLLCC